MAKFCGKCGSKLDEQTGKCPRCDAATEQNTVIPREVPVPDGFVPIVDRNTDNQTERKGKKAPKASKPPKTPKKSANKSQKPLIITIVVMLLALATAAVVGWMVYSDKLDVPFVNDMFIALGVKEEAAAPNDPDNNEGDAVQDPNGTGTTTSPEDDTNLGGNYEVPAFDAEQYFKDNTTLISTVDVNASLTVSTESEAYDHFAERGFDGEIFYDYTMDGGYVDLTEISRYSAAKHPMYQAYYTTAAGDIWLITEVNGSFYASPLTYNYTDEGRVPVIISETDTITSYDSTTNKFYVNIPHASDSVIKTIVRIDAQTLEALTGEEIDKL